MEVLMEELQRRWQGMFAALSRGEDLPPGRRLRAEGMAEAAVLLDLAASCELDEIMDKCYEAALGRPLAEDFGNDWRVFSPFPEIPAMAPRAPVYPSTAD